MLSCHPIIRFSCDIAFYQKRNKNLRKRIKNVYLYNKIIMNVERNELL